MFSYAEKKMYTTKNTYPSMEQITHLTGRLGIKNDKESYEEKSEGSKPVFRFSSSELFDCDEDTVYRIGDPFEKLTKLMFEIHDGKILKRVLRKGYGPLMSSNSTVTIHYKAYAEHQLEPFDSTSKSSPYTILLSRNQPFPGLNIAIKSMQVGEVSHFLINSEFAYGKVEWLNQVSPNDSVLFVVELKTAFDSNESKKTPRDVFIATHASCTKGNELFSKNLIKPAIKEYLNATSQLEVCKVCNNVDLEKQRLLLLRLYTNLVIAYIKIHEPRHACTYCKKVYDMCRGTNLSTPVKVYINHARALILLDDLKRAEKMLHEAKRLEPHNEEIAKEFLKLESIKKDRVPNKIIPVKSICLSKQPVQISNQFKDAMRQYCRDLINDNKATQYQLPDELSQAEQEFALTEMQRYGLHFKESQVNGVTKFFISKRSFWNS